MKTIRKCIGLPLILLGVGLVANGLIVLYGFKRASGALVQMREGLQ